MTLHKLCNSKHTAVPDMLEGLVALNAAACMLDGADQVGAIPDQILSLHPGASTWHMHPLKTREGDKATP